ncbi:YHS domain-containing (seleno)protein [Acaryochloris sp. 'Moss Beach']|uniref:YHS domain-containing (seleno)protein n=1 Tax=Acaryochloris sp. 'Moss Beach' TaxID=2740837 RepID=UPI001F455237|nr:YHS domain-containing (seleno)protein [Acaryochloris sp. 'Moss Beach']
MNPKTLANFVLSFVVLLSTVSRVSSITRTGGIAVANPVSESTSPAAAVFAEDGIAIRGTDPVAYFTEGRPIPGIQDYAYEWQGGTWLFANAKHRDLFANNPKAYAPQYGGFCAYGVSQGALVSIVPEAWAIVDGKLYLNVSADVQQLWQEDIPSYISQANQNWPTLVSKNEQGNLSN